jgi:hypothetical protein
LFSVERPTPKSDESCGRVKPLLVAIRTASRRNSSVYFFAIPYLLHSKYCSKETGTKTGHDQIWYLVQTRHGLQIAFKALFTTNPSNPSLDELQPRGKLSSAGPIRLASQNLGTSRVMARLSGESSNTFFATLEEWERHLRAVEASNTVTQDNNPRCGHEHFGT